MRFWLVVSWRHGWESQGMEARAFSDHDHAKAFAHQYNGVLIEVFQNEKDFRTYVSAHDYEFRDDKNLPMPAKWFADLTVPNGRKLIPMVSPIIRVGQDISHKAYEAVVKEDG